MSLPYDATLKALLEESPEDWPVLAGLPRQPTEVIDADIATVSGAADKVLRLRGATPAIMHVELQSGHDASLPRRIHVYNAILEHRHELPVLSVVVLVRPRADHANLTGTYEQGLKGESPYLNFRFQVIRVWQEKPERFLTGGLGLLPLATISAVSEAQLPGIIRQMQGRLEREKGRISPGDFWTSTNVLMGLRYKVSFIEQILEGVLTMKESVTYQKIIREGREEGAVSELRKIILLQGRLRFGPEPLTATNALASIDQIEVLEQLVAALVVAESWQTLLAQVPPTPPTRQRRSRTKKRL